MTTPPPCPLPLHILRPAGLLLPLFLPQDVVNTPADLLGFFHVPFQRKIPPVSVSLSAVSLAYSAFHAFTGRAVLPIITKARVGAQARYPCAPPPFRLPSAPVRHTLSMKNAPAGFGRSEVDVWKFFDG